MSEGQVQRRREAMGGMVLAVIQLEHSAYRICRELGVRNETSKQIDGALAEARRQAISGLPPWVSGITTQEVVSFVDRARPVFRVRNDMVHGGHNVVQWDGTEWTPVLALPRKGEYRAYDMLAELEALTALANEVFTLANPLERVLIQAHQALMTAGDPGGEIPRWFNERHNHQQQRLTRALQCEPGCALLDTREGV